jgi:hypothetical protein
MLRIIIAKLKYFADFVPYILIYRIFFVILRAELFRACAKVSICETFGIEIKYENIRLYITRWGVLHQLGL